MREITSDLLLNTRFRMWVTVGIVAFCTFLELYIHLYEGQATGYSHFFYIFLILIAILYHTRAVWFGVYLAVLNLVIEYSNTGGIIDISAYQRVIGFILVPLFAGFILEQIERDHGDLIEYLSDRAFSQRSGLPEDREGSSDACRPTLAGTTVRNLKKTANIRALINALSNRDAEVRFRSAIALGELGDSEAVEALSGALKDEDSGVRWEAAEALGKIGAPAIDPLIEALMDDDDDIRWRAAIALGDIRDPKVIQPLVHALADEDEYVRKRAALSLSRIGEPAIEPLLIVLTIGEPMAKEGAALAIAGMDEEAQEAVKRALETVDEDLKSSIMNSITIKKV
jgi:hypothetical protein